MLKSLEWKKFATSSYSPDPIGGISATVYVADVTMRVPLMIYPEVGVVHS